MKIKVGDLRHIEGLYLGGEISYSRQVEMLNEIANQPDTSQVESIMPTEEEILKEANYRVIDGAESNSYAGGARWAIRIIKSRLAGEITQNNSE